MLWLPLALLVVTSCRGSEKPTVQKLPTKPKLIRTLTSGEYQEIKCGLQDQTGNLWFGTTGEGVFRYNQDGFMQFTVKDGLANNTVWSILQDRKGRIWFGTDSGLTRWDGRSMTAIPFSPNQPGPADAVWSLLEDRHGTVWIGAASGMFCDRDETITRFLENPKVQNPNRVKLKMVDAILEDRHGNLWFASGMPPGLEGLCRFDGTSLTQFKPGGENWVRTLNEDRDGRLWLGTRHNGVWQYDGKTFSPFSGRPQLGSPLLFDRNGNIWFGGEEDANGRNSLSGIWRYDGKQFQNFSVKDGLGKYFPWCMVEDRAGNVWIGTRNMGLYRYDGKQFSRFSN